MAYICLTVRPTGRAGINSRS